MRLTAGMEKRFGCPLTGDRLIKMSAPGFIAKAQLKTLPSASEERDSGSRVSVSMNH